MAPIIPHNDARVQSFSAPWQDQFIDTVLTVEELAALIELPLSELKARCAQQSNFPLRAPRSYIRKIRKGCIEDPLLRQILPLPIEEQKTPGYHTDPLDEQLVNPEPGLLHKYKDRALITATAHCQIHCRYCFRRHFPYKENSISPADQNKIIQYIKSDLSLKEVIFSGGDPLSLANKKIQQWYSRLSAITHLKRIRIHTRTGALIPERFDEELLRTFSRGNIPSIVVFHINHANEIDGKLDDACKQLLANGVTLLNQSVLLKGVNNTTDTLVQLSERLFDAGVLPYYLHLPDKVHGTAHFDVNLQDARRLISSIGASLPGYLVPRLTREESGHSSKIHLGML